MAKELYLYNPIYSYTAEDLMRSFEEFKDEEITLRVNTPGGSVFDGYGILAKMKEHGNVTIMLDGMAASMGAFMLPYAKKVIAYDLAKVMIHRADAYTGGDQTRIDNLADIVSSFSEFATMPDYKLENTLLNSRDFYRIEKN